MDVAALVSGGKDSWYATYLTKKAGHNIKYILCMISENPESYMFHVPNAGLVEEQASLARNKINSIFVEKRTKGEKEKELEDLKKALEVLGIDGLVTGAVASQYQKKRIDKICHKLKIEHITPLWKKEPEALLDQMLKDGFEFVIVAVAAEGLGESWLGRKIDKKAVGELIELNKKYGVHILGEGGELETFIVACPMFSKKIKIIDAEKHWDEKTRSGWLEIKEIGH